MDLSTSPTAPRPTSLPQDGLPAPKERPNSPEEAAKAFEKVLVRRFVKTMTKNIFDNALSGNDGPSWMNGQRDQQRDMMTDVLTDHIVASDTMGLRDMLLRDWGVAPSQSPSPVPSPAALPSGPRASSLAPVPPRPAQPHTDSLSIAPNRR